MDELETVRMAGALVGMLDGLGYADGDIHGGAWVMEPYLLGPNNLIWKRRWLRCDLNRCSTRKGTSHASNEELSGRH